MANRMDRYDNSIGVTRSQKNQDKYNNISDSSYLNYDKLPVSNNINEIDINSLKKIATNRDEYRKLKELEDTMSIKRNVIEEQKNNQKQEKIYDINKLIDKAREEKEKLQKVQEKIINTNYNFLNTLESSIMYNEIKKEEEREKEKLELTRQFKFQNNKSSNPTLEEIIEDTAKLSLDILSDLKPTDNTIVTKPIDDQTKPKITEVKPSDFYSGTYNFSKKDFMSGDVPVKIKKSNTFAKVFIIVLTLIIIVLAVIYALNYFDIDIVSYLKK